MSLTFVAHTKAPLCMEVTEGAVRDTRLQQGSKAKGGMVRTVRSDIIR